MKQPSFSCSDSSIDGFSIWYGPYRLRYALMTPRVDSAAKTKAMTNTMAFKHQNQDNGLQDQDRWI